MKLTKTSRLFLALSFILWPIAFSDYLKYNPDKQKPKTTDTAIKMVGKQRLKNDLRDPSSLEIIEERVIRPGRNGSKVGYYAKFRAKNGFGGYEFGEYYTE